MAVAENDLYVIRGVWPTNENAFYSHTSKDGVQTVNKSRAAAQYATQQIADNVANSLCESGWPCRTIISDLCWSY